MANSRSARKRIRANERKRVRNRTVRSAVRTRITKARRALLGVEVESAPELVLAAVRELDRAAEKGILHRNNADRRKSRLMAMAHRLTQTAGEDQAAARSTAAGGEKGRSGRGAKGAAAKSAAKSTAKPAAKSAAKTTTRAAADKPKTTSTRAKKA